ncbi:hypothetical protein L6452_03242 [Arctium lappa]|uniref:Uncharacterized protein n=1 Tax=Arctium lappa TaxID=4217 RepID=A0ACB9FMP2_ARCLA|nr:hypothetical protein L6452_03242 [Arctium lappa]
MLQSLSAIPYDLGSFTFRWRGQETRGAGRKYLQLQSGAKSLVTRDMDADPHSLTTEVELTGSAESKAKAEQFIKYYNSQSFGLWQKHHGIDSLKIELRIKFQPKPKPLWRAQV